MSLSCTPIMLVKISNITVFSPWTILQKITIKTLSLSFFILEFPTILYWMVVYYTCPLFLTMHECGEWIYFFDWLIGLTILLDTEFALFLAFSNPSLNLDCCFICLSFLFLRIYIIFHNLLLLLSVITLLLLCHKFPPFTLNSPCIIIFFVLWHQEFTCQLLKLFNSFLYHSPSKYTSHSFLDFDCSNNFSHTGDWIVNSSFDLVQKS